MALRPVLAALCLTVASCLSTRVAEPGPLAHNLAPHDAHDAIERVMERSRAWSVVTDRPNRDELIAEVRVEPHVARVRIGYGDGLVRIHYVDSQNLGYDEDDRSIHVNYNWWVDDVAQRIDAELRAYERRLAAEEAAEPDGDGDDGDAAPGGAHDPHDAEDPGEPAPVYGPAPPPGD